MRPFGVVACLVPAIAAAEIPDIDEPEPPPSRRLGIGTDGGWWEPGLLAQLWYQVESAGGETALSTFRVRRAQLSVHGEIVPERWAFRIMIDPARVREDNDTRAVLHDAFITLRTERGDVSFGQMKIPVSWEGSHGSEILPFPERAPVAQRFGNRRHVGVRIAKSFTHWGYNAGLYNSTSENTIDRDLQKDLGLRLEAYPVPGMTLAAVAYDAIGERDRAGTEDRWEFDVRYASGPYLVQAEYIRARDVENDGAAATASQGFYVTAGYTLEDPALYGKLQPVARIGKLDELWTYDVGVNYYIRGDDVKVQLAYELQDVTTAGVPNGNLFTLAAQLYF